MKKVMIGAAVVGAGLVVVRFAPALAERGMRKCHEMMARMGQGGEQACACQERTLKAATV